MWNNKIKQRSLEILRRNKDDNSKYKLTVIKKPTDKKIEIWNLVISIKMAWTQAIETCDFAKLENFRDKGFLL